MPSAKTTGAILNQVAMDSAPATDVDVDHEDAAKEEMVIDTSSLQERFKFFEEFKDQPKKPRRFEMTPPRDLVSSATTDGDLDSVRDVTPVRSSYVISDLPKNDTARKMLGKFKQLESQSSLEALVPSGPKPLKRITPPRDVVPSNGVENNNNGREASPERDPSIVRASYKTKIVARVAPEIARNLKAKFENWTNEAEREMNQKNGAEDELASSIDITKNLKAKFEAIKLENSPVKSKPKMRVNRFVAKRSASFVLSTTRSSDSTKEANYTQYSLNGNSNSGNHSSPEDELPFDNLNSSNISEPLPAEQNGHEVKNIKVKSPIHFIGGLLRSRTTGSIRNQVAMDSPPPADVVKHDDSNKEEMVIDTNKLQERFKFFEEFKDQPKEPKRFEMTPPREVPTDESSEIDSARDPNVVRSSDVINDLPTSDTAKKMLGKFKQMESQSSNETVAPPGPKPLKRITPPRDVVSSNGLADNNQNGREASPERDPNIVRASYKTDDVVSVAPEITRNLKAKFENWTNDADREMNQKNGAEPEDEFAPSIDITKNLKAKFEAIKLENKPVNSKPKMRVNRFVQETATSQGEDCSICGKRLYPMEKLEFNGVKLHKACFKCTYCSSSLRIENYTFAAGKFYCIAHFKQLFMAKGNYDEGFGREQHKEKWNSRTSSRNQTPDDLEEVESTNHEASVEQVAA
ncbi:Xin actin-binding repeat-containing protein 2 [Halotydeus destructor]|nr:Xin actin-binding repeat-containing protein 2 [Halotydeus destructor]